MDGNQGENLVVATATGYLYHFDIDLYGGGPCRLIKENTLLEEGDDDDDDDAADASTNPTTATPTASSSGSTI